MTARNEAAARFATIMRDLSALARITFSDGTEPIYDEHVLIDLMDEWAERAVDQSLIRLFTEDAFGPFWLGLERKPTLAALFFRCIDDVRHTRTELAALEELSPTGANAVSKRDLAPEHHARYVNRLAQVISNPASRDRLAALSELCRIAQLEDLTAMAELERLARQPNVLQLLRDLAVDQGNPDQGAASSMLRKLSEQELGVAAKASYAERARQGVSELLARVRSLSAPALSFSLQPIPGMASGTTQFIAQQDGVNGNAHIEVENDGTRLLIELVIELSGESVPKWAGNQVVVVFNDLTELEQLQADGVQWYWIGPGVFHPNDLVSAGGRLTVELGISTNVVHEDTKAFHTLLRGGFLVMDRLGVEPTAQGAE